MMKKCIITLATDDFQYHKGLNRLRESIKKTGFKGDFLYWLDSYPIDCPSHSQVPFAFKPFCFKEAKERGYEAVLWLDVSVIVVRPLTKLFKIIENEGYLLFKHGSVTGEWCSDDALESFGISREQALGITNISAAFIGLNMKNNIALEFLNRWFEKAIDGVTFRGTRDETVAFDDIKCNRNGVISGNNRVLGHRHDQVAAGIIANQLSMKLTSRGASVYNKHYIMRSAIIVVNHDVKGNGKPIGLNRVYFIKYLSYLYLPFFLLRKIWKYMLYNKNSKNKK